MLPLIAEAEKKLKSAGELDPSVKENVHKAIKSDCKDIAKLAILMWGNHTLEELIEEFETVIQDKECAIFIVSVGDKK